MNPPKTPAISKLILVVLVLNLALLVVLVLRKDSVRGPDPAKGAIATRPAEGTGPIERFQLAARRNADGFTPPRESSANTGDVDQADGVSEAAAPPFVQGPPATGGRLIAGSLAATDGVAGGNTGVVWGRVTVVGTPPPEKVIPLDATCGKLSPDGLKTRFYVIGPDGGLANVFVSVGQVPSRYTPPTNSVLLDQIGCQFEPYVIGVQTGQVIAIRNSDPVLHNVHATPKENPEFSFGQPLRGQVNQKTFTTPEDLIRIKCDVHPWMFAYVGVSPHPFFAVTDTNGVFALPPGLPAGSYSLGVRHLKAGFIRREFVFTPGANVELDFVFNLETPHVAAE